MPNGGETQWPAPAKLNLFLHVTGRRPDGYHELQTLFQLIDLCDTIAIRVHGRRSDRAAGRSRGGRSGLGPHRARRQGAAGRDRLPGWGVAADCEADPHGRGTWAGEARTPPRSCWRSITFGAVACSIDELARLGLPLGADVPVFIRGSSAWAEGVGERLVPVELPERWYVVIHPGVAVPTRDVFQSPELTRNSPVITIRAFFEAGGYAGSRNDCEPVVRARYPEVADALSWLGNFAPARLTGTGSCIFASFASAIDAERVAARVPDRWRAFVARGLNVSPVHALLQS